MRGSSQRSGRPLRAVLFDAGNTLVFLDYERLAEGVGSALGLRLTGPGLAVHADEASRAMERVSGSDQQRAATFLETLFRLGGAPAERMGEVAECLARMHAERHLWCSIRDKTREALGRLRAAGLRLGVVSNSDGRVEEALRVAGLSDYFDVVIDSGLVGFEKPDPRIFEAALTALSVRAEESLYVGDLYEVDVVGARAAGIEPVLLATSPGPGQTCRTAATLDDLVDTLLAERI